MCNTRTVKLTAVENGVPEADCLGCGVAYRGERPYSWASSHECGYSIPIEASYEFRAVAFAARAAA